MLNKSKKELIMKTEEIKNCRLENVKDLVSFAYEKNIQVPYVYDLDNDKDIINETIKKLMDESGIELVYEYIKSAAKGKSRYASEDNYGCLIPFTEKDFEQLKEYLLIQLS